MPHQWSTTDRIPAPVRRPGCGLTDGEHWTREALSDLRRGGYRPAAWRRFLRASLDRSSDARRSRPALAAQARAWGLTGAGAWLAACRACRRIGVTARPAPGLVWCLATWKMLDWHLGMVEGLDGSRRRRLCGADACTLTRVWLVPLVVAARTSPQALAGLIVAGGLSDALDGALARRGGPTRLGRDLDSIADLLFVTAAAGSARAAGRLPSAAALALGARCVLGGGGAVVATFAAGRRPPLRARRWGAALRIGGLAAAAANRRRLGAAAVVAGSLVPPRTSDGDGGLFEPAGTD